MFRKPGFPILICLITLLTVGLPSCGGPDYVAFTDIREIDFYDYAAREYLSAPFITDSDSVSMFISLEWTSFSYFEIKGTMQEAWAFQPSDPILANEIIDIRIFCDRMIYGMEAGENVAPSLRFGSPHHGNYTLAEYLADLPSKGDVGYGIDWLDVFLFPRPLPGNYTFTVEIEDNSGNIFTGTSPTIEWL